MPICGASKENFETGFDGPKEMDSNESAINSTPDFERVVIIGGGIAAFSAATTLRENSDTIAITLITNESLLPYYRLNLTKVLSAGAESEEEKLVIKDQYWYDEQRIKVLKNRVVIDLNREANEVLLFDGTSIHYDRLIMALGAHPFVPPFEGATLKGVTSLRTHDDISYLKDLLNPSHHVMVIGGGVLGMEAAGALVSLGCRVTVAESSEWLMPRQLNKKAASYVDSSLSEMGIEVLYNYRTRSITETKKGLRVTDQEERIFDVDYVILATGVRPNTYIARKTHLEVDKGVVVDNYMKTSDDHIYAAGDITEHYGLVYGLWHVAMYQGKIAALNLLGGNIAFGGVPRSNTLKVLDIDLFSVGEIRPIDGSYSIYEEVKEDAYITFLVHDQQLVGSIAIGYKDYTHRIQKAVESGKFFKPEELRSTTEILKSM